MDSKQLEKRKKVLLDLMNDKIYVPMKIKELAIILQVSKEERPDLELVLNELLAEGKSNRLVAYRNGEFVDYDIQEALNMTKDIPAEQYEVAKLLVR